MSEALDDLPKPCYNKFIYHKCHDERVVNALQRFREDTVGVSVPAAVSKSRSEQQTGKPAAENRLTGRPPSSDRQYRIRQDIRCRKSAVCSGLPKQPNSGGTAD